MGGMPRALVATALGTGLLLGGAGGAAGLLSRSTPAGGSGAGDLEPITVIPADGPPDLFPGFNAGDVTVRLENPNPFAVTVRTMTPNGVTSGDPEACPSSNVTVRPADGLALFVAAASTTGPLTIPDVVSMARDAPDGCQGVGFTIRLDVTADRSGAAG
jgi:hypothetical protein